MPLLSPLVSDEAIAAAAAKPPSDLPSFRYVSPRLHQGRALVLGDAAHLVKPYFGLGANSALEDVEALGDVLDGGAPLERVPALFSRRRAKESRALVRLSRKCDRTGLIGFLTFILPLILDSIFHAALPAVFGERRRPLQLPPPPPRANVVLSRVAPQRPTTSP